ncbi:MAG: response regulator with CheY-like receiver domain and winged-helix DNA-binding domain [Parcubacteria group bacterium Gr01-1014_33]|nr:MAG: response regulator with CheY-like receiver domain and winged-helix DNA-binding domain [Parcubacteria group bacterium Gr01-1014_33]
MKKILFIEDELGLQRAVSQVLQEQGFEVFSELNGEMGILRAQKELPDLILLDIVLPRKDGFAVFKELRANPLTEKIPVIVLSNLEGGKDIQKMIELGATTYLVKINYKLDEVVEKIKSVLKE